MQTRSLTTGGREVRVISYEKLRDRVNGTTPFTYMNQKIKDILNGKYG